jgi:hypothetical protein
MKLHFFRWYAYCMESCFNRQVACGAVCQNKINNQQTTRGKTMKMNQLLAVCGIAAALFLGAGHVFAQNDNGGNGGNGGGNNGGGRPGRGNFDPAQMQQRMLERVQTELGLTNETDWSAIQPLVQKVMDAQRDARSGQLRGMFGRNRGGNNGGQGGGNRGGFGGTPSPEAETLQKAIDDNAPKAQIKDLLTKYQAAQKAKQAKLAAAQADLRAVLTVKQEASATLMGLLD